MTVTDSRDRRGRTARNHWTMFAAAGTAAALAAGAIVTAGGGAAGAAPLPEAQSVGNFLDATLGNKPIDQLAYVKYATARAPGTQSVQNPLDVTALGTIHLPLTGSLQLQKIAGTTAGALQQVAVANSDGSSYGAAGAVANSGGVSIGGNNKSFPSSATVALCASALNGGTCDAKENPADALGEIKLDVGAVAAIAATPKGYGKPGSTQYGIAGLNLDLSSPMLGKLLTTLSGELNQTGLISKLANLLTGGAALPSQCDFTQVVLPSSLDLGNGITISATSGRLTIDLDELLDSLHFNVNEQPANTDLFAKLLAYLTSVDGLTAGVEGQINGAVSAMETQFKDCAGAVSGLPDLISALNQAQGQFEQSVNNLVGSLSTVGGGTGNPLAPIGDALKKVIDIGVNVQPNGPVGTFTSALAATPKQGTPVVKGQTIVRAIEIDLVGDPAAVVALANAAAGPSTAPAPAPGPAGAAAPSGAPAAPDQIPTGVPAGSGTHGGLPLLPLGLLLLALMFAGGGAVAFKLRGRLNQR